MSNEIDRSILIQLDRNIAETGKLIAEQLKLAAEERKRHAEADKFGHERLPLVIFATAAVTLAIAAMGGLFVKTIGL